MEAEAHARRILERALLEADPRRALAGLRREGHLSRWLPEVEALAALRDTEEHPHKDLWEHTVQVVAQSPLRAGVRWAALLHDVGKVATRRLEASGAVTFIGHPEEGARLFEARIAPRLGFDPGECRALADLIRHHQRVAQYEPAWSDSAVRRLGQTLGDGFDDLLDLGRADVTTRFPERRQQALERIEALAARWRALQAADARPPALPGGLGHRVMAQLGLAPGPALGAVMRRLEAEVEAERLPRDASPEVYLQWLERNPT